MTFIYQDKKPIYRRYIIFRELFSKLKYDNPIYQRYISDIKVIFHQNYKSNIYDISIFSNDILLIFYMSVRVDYIQRWN